MNVHDHIIVGSGCTGAMAAQTLVESGVSVLMLDAGHATNKYAGTVPDKSFLDIRQNASDQHRYFIGDDGEGITWGPAKTGEHFTPPRKYILDLIEKYIPISSETFFPMESLAYGGLGNAWGLGCCQFSSPELAAAGLNPDKMRDAYTVIANRIGIAGTVDDASPYTTGSLKGLLPPPLMDQNQSSLFKKYNRQKQKFKKNGFFMGRTSLALLTKDLGDRKKYAYHDTDFYADHNNSAYRPWQTVEKLKSRSNFIYTGNRLVTHFTEKDQLTQVHCINILTNETEVFNCKTLILSPGVLGTARIVLRSFESQPTRLPLLSNPYAYIPCIQLSETGRGAEAGKTGFSQLSLFHDQGQTNFDVSMASIYSYQSLMLFRIIKEAPLNFVDSAIIMRYLMSGMVIMGLHHPDQPTASKYLELIKDNATITGDKLRATYISTSEELSKIKTVEKKYARIMRSTGTFAIKRIHPGNGSSIHYAGTLPFNSDNSPFSLFPNGKLGGANNVYVADGSGFRYLPAKGLTFSLMANAHLVAKNVLANE